MNNQCSFGTGQTWAHILVVALNYLCGLSESTARSEPAFSYAEDTELRNWRPGVGMQRGSIFNA